MKHLQFTEMTPQVYDVMAALAAQFVHTQLARLQAITDGLAQAQEATNE